MDSEFENGSINSVSISEGSNSRSSRSKKKLSKNKPKRKKGISFHFYLQSYYLFRASYFITVE